MFMMRFMIQINVLHYYFFLLFTFLYFSHPYTIYFLQFRSVPFCFVHFFLWSLLAYSVFHVLSIKHKKFPFFFIRIIIIIILYGVGVLILLIWCRLYRFHFGNEVLSLQSFMSSHSRSRPIYFESISIHFNVNFFYFFLSVRLHSSSPTHLFLLLFSMPFLSFVYAIL